MHNFIVFLYFAASDEENPKKVIETRFYEERINITKQRTKSRIYRKFTYLMGKLA